MEIKIFASCQRKATRKRRFGRYPLLNFQRFLFLFIIFCLSTGILNSQISLKIQGTGEQPYIKEGFRSSISKVYVGTNEDVTCSETCNLGESPSDVVIEFSTTITSCAEMFIGLTNILEVNLNSFDASQVNDMNSMFKGCSNLKSINFGNINTHLVTNMERLCEDCYLLESIYLSNLDISKVTKIDFIFSNCKALTSINFGTSASTVNLEGMMGAFNHCENLKTIDLTPFNTDKSPI